MSTGRHYYIEQKKDGRYAVRAAGSERASAVLPTQKQAIAKAKEFNPDDHPNIEHVRNTKGGTRDHWR